MTQEEKAKRYDEAIDKAKKELDACDSQDCDAARQIFRLFSELKESEDERIRKEIVTFIVTTPKERNNHKKWIAWLERHEEDTYDYKRVDLDKFDERIQEFSDMLEDKPKPYWDGWYEAMEWIRTHGNPFKKQGEQKPADNVEPKFKVGDWITIDGWHYHIDEVLKSCYKVSDVNDNHTMLPHFAIDDYYRSWTIQDANDGDVLVCEDFGYTSLMLFKSFSNGRISLHCWYNSQTNNFHINTDVALRKDANIYPATKEQRDTLEKAMADAGYTFDFEKKELKKIEQKLAEWGEEDERNLNDAILFIETGTYSLDKDNLINWLKSLKERYTWKPSDLQIKALEGIRDHVAQTGGYWGQTMTEIIEHLKQL